MHVPVLSRAGHQGNLVPSSSVTLPRRAGGGGHGQRHGDQRPPGRCSVSVRQQKKPATAVTHFMGVRTEEKLKLQGLKFRRATFNIKKPYIQVRGNIINAYYLHYIDRKQKLTSIKFKLPSYLISSVSSYSFLNNLNLTSSCVS